MHETWNKIIIHTHLSV